MCFGPVSGSLIAEISWFQVEPSGGPVVWGAVFFSFDGYAYNNKQVIQ